MVKCIYVLIENSFIIQQQRGMAVLQQKRPLQFSFFFYIKYKNIYTSAAGKSISCELLSIFFFTFPCPCVYDWSNEWPVVVSVFWQKKSSCYPKWNGILLLAFCGQKHYALVNQQDSRCLLWSYFNRSVSRFIVSVGLSRFAKKDFIFQRKKKKK